MRLGKEKGATKAGRRYNVEKLMVKEEDDSRKGINTKEVSYVSNNTAGLVKFVHVILMSL